MPADGPSGSPGWSSMRAGPEGLIRLRRVPPCEPPYDDEASWRDADIPGQLVLDWSPAALARAGIETPANGGGPIPTTARDGTGLITATTRADTSLIMATAGVKGAEINATGAGANGAGTITATAGLNGDGLIATAAADRANAGGANADSVNGGGLIGVGGTFSAIGMTRAALVRAGDQSHARPAVSGVSADARIAVHRFVRHCVEVLNGYRPAGHLRQLALPAEAAAIVAQGLAGARRVASLRKAAPGRRVPRRSPAAVMRLRVCQPSTESVEAAAALVTTYRTWALALRLELHHDTWSATALRLI
jgi:mRNA-degrading endonuclease toxin of MazEF toxin-antitoxin module